MSSCGIFLKLALRRKCVYNGSCAIVALELVAVVNSRASSSTQHACGVHAAVEIADALKFAYATHNKLAIIERAAYWIRLTSINPVLRRHHHLHRCLLLTVEPLEPLLGTS